MAEPGIILLFHKQEMNLQDTAIHPHPSVAKEKYDSSTREPVVSQQSVFLVPARHVRARALSYGCQGLRPIHQCFIKNRITFSLPAFSLPAGQVPWSCTLTVLVPELSKPLNLSDALIMRCLYRRGISFHCGEDYQWK